MATAAKKAQPQGSRWVTVKKEGPLHGRRLMIDSKGYVVAGKIPKAMHGHHIGQLAGILPEGQSYHDYSHDELKEIHGEFKQHHDDLKKQLAEDVHGHAKGLRDAHVASSKEDSLVSKIRAKGGIKIAEGHQNHTEYKESVDPSVRKAVSHKNGMPLDEMASELGMSARDLIDKLSQAETSSYAKIEDFHDEAKRQMGDDYEQRKAGIKEMGKHVAAIEAAIKVHEHKKAQEKAQKEAEKAAKKEKEPKTPEAPDAHGFDSDKLKNMTQFGGFKVEKNKDGRHNLTVNGKFKGKDGEVDDEAQMGGTYKDEGQAERAAQKLRAQLEGKKLPPKENGVDPNELKNASKPKDIEPGKNLAEQKDSGKKFSDLHNDIQAHLKGDMSENDFFKKHLSKFQKSGEKVGANSKGDAEDVGGSALETAVKTLRAMKNGSQKPKEGTDLGEHLMSRVKQGSKEAARQGNENNLTREGAKLASIINQHRNAHMNETGKDPSESELFNRVKNDKAFQSTKFTKPGTKQSLDDPQEKFGAVREAMKGQRSDAVLDKQVEGKDGGVGTVGGNMADPKGSAEDQVVDLENEREMRARRDQLHGAFKEMGLSDHEAHAVSNRFGVGHQNQGFQDWDTVAKHMSKALGKKVSPDSAKKHFQNGRAKLHQHIGDDRMGLLMQKSLIVDPAVQNLIYHLHLCGIYDLLKSMGIEDEEQLESTWERTQVAMNRGELIKSLAPGEFIGEEATWSDGSVTAQIHKFSVRG